MLEASQLFVNIPVRDLKKSMEFFTRLGFSFNLQYTDEKGACMLVGKDSFVMLLTEAFFKSFTKKEVANSAATTEAILAFSVGSREAVDEMVRKALAAGGKASNDKLEEGSMYGWSFQDLDDHLWEVFYMDESGGIQAEKP